MKVHHLKIWPDWFSDVASGKKPYEIRLDDRGYEVGDVLHLQEWDPHKAAYTGSEVNVRVIHITRGSDLIPSAVTGAPLFNTFPANICVMGIERIMGVFALNL